MDGVTAASGPFPVLFEQSTLLTDKQVVDLRVFGIPSERPKVSKPIITGGRWLAADGTREIVFDKGLARELGLKVDDQVEVLTNGRAEPFKVVGFAVASDLLSYPWDDQAFAMVLPEVIERLEPDPSKRASRLSVRIAEPQDARRFGREASATYPVTAHGPGWETWLRIKEDLTEDFKLFATFFGIFGVVSIGAAAFVIVNVGGGYVMARVRDIGLLKSIGFTPRQVAALLLVKHVGLSLPATALGILLGFAAAPAILRVGATGLGTFPAPTLDPMLTVATLLGVPLGIAAITLLPAWRGGRVPPVQALTVGLARVHAKPSEARIAPANEHRHLTGSEGHLRPAASRRANRPGADRCCDSGNLHRGDGGYTTRHHRRPDARRRLQLRSNRRTWTRLYPV